MQRRKFYGARGSAFRGFILAGTGIVALLAMLAQRPGAAAQDEQGVAASPAASAQMKLRVINLYAKQPLSFERNDGQTDARVKFISRGDRYTLFLTPDEAVLALRAPLKESGKAQKAEGETLRIRLVGANPRARIEAIGQVAGKSNYFAGKDPGKWHTNIPAYARVQYRDVYPGIDLVYYGASQRQLEYDFVIAPGADPRAIGLRFDGAKQMTFNREGELVIRLAGGGEVIHHAPVIYQERDGRRENVIGRSVFKGQDAIGFELAAYDHARPVFIDPGLSYSTFLGGTGGDMGTAIAVDSMGFAYVTGVTESPDFPTTMGAYKTTPPGGGNMFVTKLQADGSGRVYSTYLGGDLNDNFESGRGIAVDSNGDAFITGDAGNHGDFPTTPGAFQPGPSGGFSDGFVTKLSADGSSLVYSTYLGGTYAPAPGTTNSSAIAIDSMGFAYVAGKTTSGSFPTTMGAFQTANNCISCTNVFVTKMKTDGTGLVYSTYLGGSGSANGGDSATGIAVDSSGNAYVAGTENSSDFPKTTGAFRTTNSGFSDAFVTKLKADGTGLVYSTYLGGSQPDLGEGIAIDSMGSAYVTGYTGSNDFPKTVGAFQGAMRTIYGNAFVTKLKPDGSGLVYSTYLGGYGDTADGVIDSFGADHAFGIAVDSFGHAYVTGETWSSNFYCVGASNPIACCSGGGTGTCNFPITSDAFQSTDNASNFDSPGPNAFMTKMNLDGSGLVYSTYLGGSTAFNGDRGFAIAIDSTGDAYVTGSSYSNDFPFTLGANQTVNNGGGGDAFVTKLIVPAGATPTPTSTGTATRTATPTATASATSTPTATATATGGSATATPTATSTPGGGRISVTPRSLALSASAAATASAGIMISNTGSGPLTVNVTAPRHNPPLTEVGGGNQIVVPAGGPGHQVTIVFSPTKKGSTKDSITITSDDRTHKKAIKVKIKGVSK